MVDLGFRNPGVLHDSVADPFNSLVILSDSVWMEGLLGNVYMVNSAPSGSNDGEAQAEDESKELTENRPEERCTQVPY